MLWTCLAARTPSYNETGQVVHIELHGVLHLIYLEINVVPAALTFPGVKTPVPAFIDLEL